MTEARIVAKAFEHAARKEAAPKRCKTARMPPTPATSNDSCASRFYKNGTAPRKRSPALPRPHRRRRPAAAAGQRKALYEARAEAACAKRPPTSGEEPLVDVRAVVPTGPRHAHPSKKRRSGPCTAAARGMVGAFRNNGSTTLVARRPPRSRPPRRREHVVIRPLAVSRGGSPFQGVDERRLALSGAFRARLRRRARRRAARLGETAPLLNLHVDEYNVATYEHRTLLYLSDHGRFHGRAPSSTTATA